MSLHQTWHAHITILTTVLLRQKISAWTAWHDIKHHPWSLFPVSVLVEGTSHRAEGEASHMLVLLTGTQQAVREVSLKTHTHTGKSFFLCPLQSSGTLLVWATPNRYCSILRSRACLLLQMFHLLFSSENVCKKLLYLHRQWQQCGYMWGV